MSKSDPSFIEADLEEVNTTFSEFIKFLRDFVIILLIVFFIRTFIITPFQINGASMEASYHDKEFILVDKFSYLDFSQDIWPSTDSSIQASMESLWQKIPIHIGDPVRWDVVVIKPHVDKDREHYIKRVIAVPWDTIKFESGSVFIKLKWSDSFIQLHEPYLSPSNSGHTYLPAGTEWNEFFIPKDTYWVMGDNRQNSADSRHCFRTCENLKVSDHVIRRSNVVWRILINFWYFNIFNEGGLLLNRKMSWTHVPRFLSHPRNTTYPELGDSK